MRQATVSSLPIKHHTNGLNIKKIISSSETKEIGENLIHKEIENIPNEKVKNIVIKNLKLIKDNNKRDFRF